MTADEGMPLTRCRRPRDRTRSPKPHPRGLRSRPPRRGRPAPEHHRARGLDGRGGGCALGTGHRIGEPLRGMGAPWHPFVRRRSSSGLGGPRRAVGPRRRSGRRRSVAGRAGVGPASADRGGTGHRRREPRPRTAHDRADDDDPARTVAPRAPGLSWARDHARSPRRPAMTPKSRSSRRTPVISAPARAGARPPAARGNDETPPRRPGRRPPPAGSVSIRSCARTGRSRGARPAREPRACSRRW